MTDAGIPMGLKPCPFCGGEAETCFNIAIGHAPMFWFLCRRCHASPGDRSTQAAAIAAWNTRATADTPPPAAAGDRSLAEAARLVAVLRNAQVGYDEFGEDITRAANMLECLALRTPEPNSGGEASNA